jgi:hypothetical protein
MDALNHYVIALVRGTNLKGSGAHDATHKGSRHETGYLHCSERAGGYETVYRGFVEVVADTRTERHKAIYINDKTEGEQIPGSRCRSQIVNDAWDKREAEIYICATTPMSHK